MDFFKYTISHKIIFLEQSNNIEKYHKVSIIRACKSKN